MEGKNEEFETLFITCGNNEGSQEKSCYINIDECNYMRGKERMFVEIDEWVNENVSFDNDPRFQMKFKR